VLLTISEFSSQTSLNRPCLRFLVHFGQFGLLLALVVWASTTLFPAELSVLILMGVPFLLVNTQDETDEPLFTIINHYHEPLLTMINHGNPINLGWWLGGYLSCSDPYSTQWTWGLEVLSVEVPWIKQQQYNPWRIHGAGILMLTWLGYIDDKCYIVTIYSSTMDPSWVKKSY